MRGRLQAHPWLPPARLSHPRGSSRCCPHPTATAAWHPRSALSRGSRSPATAGNMVLKLSYRGGRWSLPKATSCDGACDRDSRCLETADTPHRTPCLVQLDRGQDSGEAPSDRQSCRDKGAPCFPEPSKSRRASVLEQRTMEGAAQNNRDLLSPSLETGVRNPHVPRKNHTQPDPQNVTSV